MLPEIKRSLRAQLRVWHRRFGSVDRDRGLSVRDGCNRHSGLGSGRHVLFSGIAMLRSRGGGALLSRYSLGDRRRLGDLVQKSSGSHDRTGPRWWESLSSSRWRPALDRSTRRFAAGGKRRSFRPSSSSGTSRASTLRGRWPMWCCYRLFAAGVFRRISRRQDVRRRVVSHLPGYARFSCLFLVVGSFLVVLLSIDWLMALEPWWYSTIFGVYNFSGLFQSGLAVSAPVSSYGSSVRGVLDEEVNRDHIQDIAKFMFGMSTFLDVHLVQPVRSDLVHQHSRGDRPISRSA